jgi:hypothetical protein
MVLDDTFIRLPPWIAKDLTATARPVNHPRRSDKLQGVRNCAVKKIDLAARPIASRESELRKKIVSILKSSIPGEAGRTQLQQNTSHDPRQGRGTDVPAFWHQIFTRARLVGIQEADLRTEK